jgi:hypothetical protein
MVDIDKVVKSNNRIIQYSGIYTTCWLTHAILTYRGNGFVECDTRTYFFKKNYLSFKITKK